MKAFVSTNDDFGVGVDMSPEPRRSSTPGNLDWLPRTDDDDDDESPEAKAASREFKRRVRIREAEQASSQRPRNPGPAAGLASKNTPEVGHRRNRECDLAGAARAGFAAETDSAN